jgi:plasmid stabilization system protein ParE
VRVRIHPGAAADLALAGDWYEKQLPGLGLELVAELQRALPVIGDAPRVWPPWPGVGENSGVRRFLLARFPFAIGYTVKADEVIILAVAHLRRRPGYWLVRLSEDR